MFIGGFISHNTDLRQTNSSQFKFQSEFPVSSAVCSHCLLDACVCLFHGETFLQVKPFENTRAGFSNKQQGEPRLTNKDPEMRVPPDQRCTLGKPSQDGSSLGTVWENTPQGNQTQKVSGSATVTASANLALLSPSTMATTNSSLGYTTPGVAVDEVNRTLFQEGDLKPVLKKLEADEKRSTPRSKATRTPTTCPPRVLFALDDEGTSLQEVNHASKEVDKPESRASRRKVALQSLLSWQEITRKVESAED